MHIVCVYVRKYLVKFDAEILRRRRDVLQHTEYVSRCKQLVCAAERWHCNTPTQ